MTRPRSIRIASLYAKFEQHQQEIFDTSGKVNPPSHPIWRIISQEFDYSYTSKYLYTIVLCNRYGIKERLTPAPKVNVLETRLETSSSSSSSPDSTESSDDNEGDTMNFSVTLSSQEWLEIRPENRVYKDGRIYSVLKPGRWTDIVASHFWDHTKLSCTLKFKRANVHQGGCFLRIVGTCKSCRSRLEGELTREYPENGRVIIPCTYRGNFNSCQCTSKRQLKGHTRREVATLLLSTHLASSEYRKRMANLLMSHGDSEPSILQNLSVLRNAKYEEQKAKHLDSDPVISVHMLKYQHPANDFLKDIGMDRFYVHYWSTSQVHVFNNYCRNSSYSKIAIDATGGVVRKLRRPNNQKSGAIFLYDIAVRDTHTDMQYSVCNMLFERHDSDSISHWLHFWKRDGASIPNEIVCDLSVALISAIIRVFTDFSSLTKYLEYCYNLLILNETSNFFHPKCYVRSDVAHVIHIFCRWDCIKNALRRSRQFYKRCLAQLVQATSVYQAQIIIEAIFIVALNETTGTDASGMQTPCERSKVFLRNLIGDEYSDVFEQADIDEDSYERTDDLQKAEENNFVRWGQTIQKSVVANEIVEGSDDNCQYLPALVPQLIKFLKFLPLWSNIMSSVFEKSGKLASSASVESNFNDIKNRIFANVTLPTRIDEFLSHHIQSLEGTMKLAASAANRRQKDSISDSDDLMDYTTEDKPSRVEDGKVTLERETFEVSGHAEQDDRPVMMENECVDIKSPNKNNLPIVCVSQDEFQEFEEREDWRGEVSKKQKRSSYLHKNSEWLKIDLQQKANVVPIGILRNGNCSVLKPITVDKQKYILKNTCGFDSLVHLLCTNYCDSKRFSTVIDEKDNDLTKMIKQIIKQIGVKAYNIRCSLLLKIFDNKSAISLLPNSTIQLETQCTLEALLRKMCVIGVLEYTYIETVQCSEGQHLRLLPTALWPLTCANLTELQLEIHQYFTSYERSKSCARPNCSSGVTTKIEINKRFIFLEVSDKSPHPKLLPTKLREIPRELVVRDIKYTLGGLIAYSGCPNENENTLGHFKTYSCRIDNKWEIYDDMMRGKLETSDVEVVLPHLLFYRV